MPFYRCLYECFCYLSFLCWLLITTCFYVIFGKCDGCRIRSRNAYILLEHLIYFWQFFLFYFLYPLLVSVIPSFLHSVTISYATLITPSHIELIFSMRVYYDVILLEILLVLLRLFFAVLALDSDLSWQQLYGTCFLNEFTFGSAMLIFVKITGFWYLKFNENINYTTFFLNAFSDRSEF